MMIPYVVRQGDHLTRLAWCMGFDATEVWSHAKNQPLRENRPDPDMLAPGDTLFVPSRSAERGRFSVRAGEVNPFSSSIPGVNVRLTIRSEHGDVLAGEPFVVEGLAPRFEGTVGGDGAIEFKAPVHLYEVRLTFPRIRRSCSVRIGHLDPVSERSGVDRRLRQLGFQRPANEAYEDEHEVSHALSLCFFQATHGLEITGAANEETRAKLVELHGS